VHLPAYKDGAECSETSAYKIQTPGNHPKEAYKIYIEKNIATTCFGLHETTFRLYLQDTFKMQPEYGFM